MSEHRLAARLRAATLVPHRAAEGTGFMQDLLHGRIERDSYCALLRNLHDLYAALERALVRHADLPFVAPVCMPVLFRTAALAKDLDTLYGADWGALPVTRSMQEYTARINQLSAAQPALLVAHAYVRYLGDLSGGQMMRDVVRSTLALQEEAGTAFYAFGSSAEVEVMKARFRAALNALVVSSAGEDEIVTEAGAAFTFHVRLFDELERRARVKPQNTARGPVVEGG